MTSQDGQDGQDGHRGKGGYVLHYAPDNASLIIRLLLTGRGVPHRVALVDRATGAQDSAAYRRLNPLGLIPALETPEGTMFETGAILLWLGERHGGAPRADAPGRGDFLKWLFFVSNTLHADLRLIFYPETYAGPDAAAQTALHATVTRRILDHFGHLEALAASAPAWFATGRPGALDWYVMVCLRWAAVYARLDSSWLDRRAFARDHPVLAALARRLDDHPATVEVARAEGLGPTPFSDPAPDCPPEGSVL